MVYILVLGILVSLSYIKSIIKQKDIIDMIIFIFMSVFYGIRYDVGMDYMTYNNIYYNIDKYYNMEYLYELLMDIFRYFNAPNWYLTIFVGFVIFALLYFISKDNDINYDYMVLLFIITGGLFTSFNLVRQTLAALIILYSFKYIDKSLFKYMICCAIALLIHKSSFIFILFYFVNKVYLNKSKCIVLLIIGLFLYFTNAVGIGIRLIYNFIPLGYVQYIGSSFDYNVNPGLGVLYFILVNLVIILYMDDVNILESHLRAFIYLYILTYSIGLISLQSFILTRFLVYGQFSISVILPNLFRNIKNKNNIVLKVGIVFAYLIIFLISLYNSENENLIYKTIFNNVL